LEFASSYSIAEWHTLFRKSLRSAAEKWFYCQIAPGAVTIRLAVDRWGTSYVDPQNDRSAGKKPLILNLKGETPNFDNRYCAPSLCLGPQILERFIRKSCPSVPLLVDEESAMEF